MRWLQKRIVAGCTVLTTTGLCGLLLLSGCPETPAPGPQAPQSVETPATPVEQPAAVAVAPDDPAAVAALEALGVRLTKDAAGHVTAADCIEANIEDAHLLHFEKLPSLTTLSLENGKITDAGMVTVAKLSQLKSLRLQKCSQLTVEGIKLVEQLTNLDRLYVLYTYTTNDCLIPIAKLKKLKVLDLRGTKVTDAGIVHLEALTELVELKFRGDAITDAALVHVGKLPRLKVLSLEDCGVRSAGMTALSGLTELRSLNLLRTYVGDKGLKACSGMTKLEILNIRDTACGGPGLDALVGAQGSLKELDLSELLINSEGVGHVAQFTNLETLGLWNGTFDDAGLAQLAPLVKLKNLDLEGCQMITDNSMQTVATFANLTELKLKQTQIGDAGLEYLVACKQLKQLSLEQTQVSAAGVSKLKAALPNCVVKQ